MALGAHGDGARTNGSTYERRRPEETLLYDVVQRELETFLARARSRERTVPRFVEREFRAYLRCGILAHGFVRVHALPRLSSPAFGHSADSFGLASRAGETSRPKGSEPASARAANRYELRRPAAGVRRATT
jgi:hypothetical protein